MIEYLFYSQYRYEHICYSNRILFRSCKQERVQEKSVLERGISVPQSTMVSPESLPSAVQRKDEPCMSPAVEEINMFLFCLPALQERPS